MYYHPRLKDEEGKHTQRQICTPEYMRNNQMKKQYKEKIFVYLNSLIETQEKLQTWSKNKQLRLEEKETKERKKEESGCKCIYATHTCVYILKVIKITWFESQNGQRWRTVW